MSSALQAAKDALAAGEQVRIQRYPHTNRSANGEERRIRGELC
jgi:hypothetical protein